MGVLSHDVLKRSVVGAGFKWFDNQPMIVGIRTKLSVPDEFNDFLTLTQTFKNNYFKGWICTTEPGVYWLKNPGRVTGTLILKRGQYIGSHRLGYHGTGIRRHRAAIQVRPMYGWRDNNKNETIEFDPKSIEVGLWGANIHSTGISNWISPKIDKWSAGCQVMPNFDKFKNEFIPELEAYIKSINQPEFDFTYTLLDEADILY